jgi:hypothetical protein
MRARRLATLREILGRGRRVRPPVARAPVSLSAPARYHCPVCERDS